MTLDELLNRYFPDIESPKIQSASLWHRIEEFYDMNLYTGKPSLFGQFGHYSSSNTHHGKYSSTSRFKQSPATISCLAKALKAGQK